MTDNEETDHDVYDSKPESYRRLRSVVWETFTVIDRKNYVAVCNICDKKLSFKTTVTNLKKHIDRKHSVRSYLKSDVGERVSYKREHREIRHTPFDVRKSKLTDLGGLEGLVLNVIGEDGETDALVAEHEANQEVVFTEEDHDYGDPDKNQAERAAPFRSKENTANKPTTSTNPSERKKRSRIMDLQLECLEIKKYNMQLEALMLEQQLNIRRSIFTEPLQCADTTSRGTQTDVGGEHTKVFYLAEGRSGLPTQHLFAMQDLS